MGLYFIFIGIMAVAFSCVFSAIHKKRGFYSRTAYERRFEILIFSVLISLIPMSIANGIASKKCERETILTLSKELVPYWNLYDTLPQKIAISDSISIDSFVIKEIPIFFGLSALISDDDFCFHKGNGAFSTFRDISKVTLHYISVDSVISPKYEVFKDKPKKNSYNGFWISSRAIPRRNKERHLYFPDDENRLILENILGILNKGKDLSEEEEKFLEELEGAYDDGDWGLVNKLVYSLKPEENEGKNQS